MRIYKTDLYKQEVMHVVLVHSPADQDDFSEYPLLTDDDPNAICVFRDGRFIWRPEAMSETHNLELIYTQGRNVMEVKDVPSARFYVWDHAAVAFHVKRGQTLKFDIDGLRQNLKYCNPDKVQYTLSNETHHTFDEAKQLVKSLWPDFGRRLEVERSLLQGFRVSAIKLILVGWIGSGKSSIGNLILGRHAFGTASPAASPPTGGPLSPVLSFKVMEGGVASLTCQYSVKRFGLSRVCWGRGGCGTFWCSNILVQTDENGVISKVEDRYRLTGDILDGQMDLDILNVRRTDSGPYCCRVNIDGIFNDKKMIMNLRVVKAPASSPPRQTTTITMTTECATEMSTPAEETTTVNWKTLLSSQLDLLRRNSTLLRPDTVAVEDSLPSVSLQINAPILSLSISVLLVIAAVFLLLAFKRGVYRRGLKSSCFSSEEPRHIIYEIRMRRPVQENIYTLD
ncbi:T-cell immunoglobulin and mucin domain-containing protein 4 isoform X3 [Cololabis saira]|nr:T-cell immunoglobulin and mucin domain-containing protein 4 isoform X3 [Cololabis saira]